jgi:hypothetical protein
MKTLFTVAFQPIFKRPGYRSPLTNKDGGQSLRGLNQ